MTNVRSLVRAFGAAAVFCASMAAASPAVVFGPKTYSSTQSAPQTFTETIVITTTMRCAGRASFVLSVQNSSVSSGSVTLNGQVVIAESDFNAKVSSIERPVTLAGTNTLTIGIKSGAPNTAMTISIRRVLEENVFGPLTITGNSTESRTFTASNPSSTFAVVGQSNANATIRINGQDVITKADFGIDGTFRKVVALQASNTITGRLVGNSAARLTFDIRRSLGDSGCGPTIKIASPAPNAVINDRYVIVTGTVVGSTGVGISVNGVAGTVALDAAGTEADPYRWTATVAEEEGNVVLRATATARDGGTGEDSRPIFFAPDPANITFAAHPQSGTAPLTVAFDALSLGATTRVEIDYDGDGVADFIGAQAPPSMEFTYGTPGIRIARFQATRPDGTAVSGATAITVQSFATMNALLVRQWNDFADALAAGNVDQALTFLAGEDARTRYRPPLNLIRPRLAAFAAAIRDIRPAYIAAGLADYLVVRVENGRPHAYHVYFLPDADGVWKIGQF